MFTLRVRKAAAAAPAWAVSILLLTSALPASARAPRAEAPRTNQVKTTGVFVECDVSDIVLEASADQKVSSDTDVAKVATDDANVKIGAPTAENGVAGETIRGGDDHTGDAGEEERPLPLDEGKWDAVCSPPCNRRLPRAAIFRITGADITTSSSFHLPPGQSKATLRVKPGIARWYWTGVISSIFGASFVAGGFGPPLLLGGSLSTAQKILGGSGVVMMAVGVPLWILNRTRIDIF